MDDEKKLKFEIFQSALEEYSKKGNIENTRCEMCNGLLQIERLSPSALYVKCSCGYHNSPLRGL